MFTPNITAEGIAREVVSRAIGGQAVAINDLYNAFDEYFSHLKDDIKVDNMSDIEKVESHGFDKKTSFRKM